MTTARLYRCCTCHEYKPADAFPRSNSSGRGFGYACRECDKKRQRARREAGRNKTIEHKGDLLTDRAMSEPELIALARRKYRPKHIPPGTQWRVVAKSADSLDVLYEGDRDAGARLLVSIPVMRTDVCLVLEPML